MDFSLVERKQAKLRMALTGVSGAGKTLGALYTAYGITGDWGKIAFIDTEHERGRFYACRSDLSTGQFLYVSIQPPYSPEKYKELAIKGAERVGSDGVVIIDSLSHVWSSEGGVLDIKDEIASKRGKNDYSAWSDAGKIQNDLINTILSLDCHTIVTMRAKMKYAVQMNDSGKQVPVKLGLEPIQRENTEYEFDVVLDISRNHIATASKDTTFLDTYGEKITPELGERLKEWLYEGKEPDICSECGKVIKATQKHTAEELVENSVKLYGKKLCSKCCSEIYKKGQKKIEQTEESPKEENK